MQAGDGSRGRAQTTVCCQQACPHRLCRREALFGGVNRAASNAITSGIGISVSTRGIVSWRCDGVCDIHKFFAKYGHGVVVRGNQNLFDARFDIRFDVSYRVV